MGKKNCFFIDSDQFGGAGAFPFPGHYLVQNTETPCSSKDWNLNPCLDNLHPSSPHQFLFALLESKATTQMDLHLFSSGPFLSLECALVKPAPLLPCHSFFPLLGPGCTARSLQPIMQVAQSTGPDGQGCFCPQGQGVFPAPTSEHCPQDERIGAIQDLCQVAQGCNIAPEPAACQVCVPQEPVLDCASRARHEP